MKKIAKNIGYMAFAALVLVEMYVLIIVFA